MFQPHHHNSFLSTHVWTNRQIHGKLGQHWPKRMAYAALWGALTHLPTLSVAGRALPLQAAISMGEIWRARIFLNLLPLYMTSVTIPSLSSWCKWWHPTTNSHKSVLSPPPGAWGWALYPQAAGGAPLSIHKQLYVGERLVPLRLYFWTFQYKRITSGVIGFPNCKSFRTFHKALK